MKKTIYLLTLIAIALAWGCSTPKKSAPKKERRYEYGVDAKAKKNKFEKIVGARLNLYPPIKRQYKAGETAMLNITLGNDGRNSVSIPEWRINEVDNITLYCQPWLPNMKNPDPEMWVPVNAPITQPEKRYKLVLLSGNQTTVSKPLTFVKDLVISKGSERRYFLKAELNLTSYKATSEVFGIAISNQ